MENVINNLNLSTAISEATIVGSALGSALVYIAVVIISPTMGDHVLIQANTDLIRRLGLYPITPEHYNEILLLPNLGGFTSVIHIIPTCDWWNRGGTGFCPIISRIYPNINFIAEQVHHIIPGYDTVQGFVLPVCVAGLGTALIQGGYPISFPCNRLGYFMLNSVRNYLFASLLHITTPGSNLRALILQNVGAEGLRQLRHFSVFNIAYLIEHGVPSGHSAYLSFRLTFDVHCLQFIDGLIAQMQVDNPLYQGANSQQPSLEND